MNENVMNPKDGILGALANCYITIGNERYCFMQLTDFESKAEISLTEINRLGTLMVGHKPGLIKGTWKGTAHYNQAVMRDLSLNYKNSAIPEYFDIQVTNDDPASAAGRQTITHRNCLTEGGILAKFDVEAEYLDEEISGTFDDWDMPEKFSRLSGM